MSDGLITRQELSQDLNEELNKTGTLTDLDPSLTLDLQGIGKDINLVNAINQTYSEVTKPDWTPALTQMKSIFSVGTGTNPDGVEVDYSNSVTKGQISDVTIKGRTVVNLLGTKGECDNVSVFNYSSNVTGVVENGRIKITCTNDNDTWRFHIGWINGIEVNKCYFARIDIENTNIPELRFIMSNNINQAFSVSSQQSGKFSLFLKFKFTSTNPAQYSIGLTYGANIASGYLNKQCYIDNLALFEITENEYNALSEAELAQKYPYISGTKSTLCSFRLLSKNTNKCDYEVMDYTGKSYSERFKPIKLDSGTYYFKYTGDVNGKILDSNKSVTLARNNESFTLSQPSTVYFYGVDSVYNNIMVSHQDISYVKPERSQSIVYKEDENGNVLEMNCIKDTNGNVVANDEIRDGKLYKRTEEKNDVHIQIGWTIGYALTNTVLFQKTNYINNAKYIDASTRQNAMLQIGSNIFNAKTATILRNIDEEGFAIYNGNVLEVRINKSRLSSQDSAGFIAWLQAQGNSSLIYQLAQEEVYDLNMTPLQIFEGGSVYVEPIKIVNGEIIDADSSESIIPEITIKYPVNLAGVVQSNTDAISRQSAILNEHESMLLTLSLQIIDLQP